MNNNKDVTGTDCYNGCGMYSMPFLTSDGGLLSSDCFIPASLYGEMFGDEPKYFPRQYKMKLSFNGKVYEYACFAEHPEASKDKPIILQYGNIAIRGCMIIYGLSHVECGGKSFPSISDKEFATLMDHLRVYTVRNTEPGEMHNIRRLENVQNIVETGFFK